MKRLFVLLLLLSACFAIGNGEQVSSATVAFHTYGFINRGFINLRVPYETDYQTVDLEEEINMDEVGGKIKVKDDFAVNIDVNVDYSQIEITNDEKIGKYSVGFLGKTEKIDPGVPGIKSLVKDFDSEYILETVKEVTQFSYHYITYDSSRIGEDPYDTNQILGKKKGVCVEYAILTASLLRAKGIPTKYVVGFVQAGNDFEPHGWIEFYTEKYGWLPSDPTKNQMIHIDGTHVKIGEADDPTEIFDKIHFTGAEADYEKEYGLEIKNQKFFDTINSEININPNEIGFGSFADINLEIKNPKNSMLFISALMLHDEQIKIYDDVSKIIFLKPKETRNFVWKVKSNDAEQEGKTIIHTFKLKSQALEGETVLHVSKNFPVITFSEVKISKYYEIGETKVRVIVEVQNTGGEDIDGELFVSETDEGTQTKEMSLRSGDKKIYDFYFDKGMKFSHNIQIQLKTDHKTYETKLEIPTGFFLLKTEHLLILFGVLLLVVIFFLAAKKMTK